jgi:multicomponent Na+:H+ antiporter subunit F
MSPVPSGPLGVAVPVVSGLLLLALLLAFVRLVRGPSLPDRVVALDLMASIVVGLIATFTVAGDQPVFLDPAIVLALIAFVGTVAFAYYLAKGLPP